VADEVRVAFGLAGTPDENRLRWKDAPPSFVADYRLVDESYDTLVYEANVTTVATKIMMFGFAKTIYKLMVTFTPGEGTPTRVTLSGQAKEPVRDDLARYLREETQAL